MIPSIYSAISGFSFSVPFRDLSVNFHNRMSVYIEQISPNNRLFQLAKVVVSIAIAVLSAVILIKGLYWCFFQNNAKKMEEGDEDISVHFKTHIISSFLESPKNKEARSPILSKIPEGQNGENESKKPLQTEQSEVLFEIRKANLDTGLRGYPVGYCTTSSVDPIKGLSYAGRPVSEIDQWEPEEVIYLLYHGREGTEDEVCSFSDDLAERSLCSQELIDYIEQLPKKADPMRLFTEALLLTGTFEGKNQYREDCLNLIAKAPEIAATVINYHAGWGITPPSRPGLGYVENFTQMLNVPNADEEQLTQALKLFSILHLDHGGGNLSTFIGKGVASGLADLYYSIAAAMCALAGPKHGGANQDCLDFVQKLVDDLGENAKEEEVEKILREKLAKKELIYGFGHAVLRVEDPRATLLYNVTQRDFPDHPLVKMAHLLRKVCPKVLKENTKISNPYPNVDAISGVLLSAAGFPYPEYYTILFGLSRIVGIARQIEHERVVARTPIVRPKYLFKSPLNL